MSSLGSQWRILRHYLSMSNLHTEVEKLARRLSPATPEQWDMRNAFKTDLFAVEVGARGLPARSLLQSLQEPRPTEIDAYLIYGESFKSITADLIRRFEKAISTRLLQKSELEMKSDNVLQMAPAKIPSVLRSSSTTLKDSITPGVTVTDEKDLKKNEEMNRNDLKETAQDKMNHENITIGSDLKGMTMEGLLEGIKLKKDLHFGNISELSWKHNKPVVSKTSIHSRTAYVISALVTAEAQDCLRRRTENFIDHLVQYPEARDYAIKEGGVRALLRVQRKLEPTAAGEGEREVDGLVKEALALMGYTAPSKGPGPNILSIDGGGIRGLIAIEILRQLEKLTGRRVNELFDYIVGVSTGAIIAAVLSSGVGTLDTASDMYHTLSKKMFGNTSLIGGTSRLVLTHSYYDTEAWEALLKENLGEMQLTHCNRHNTPKMALVSCVVNSGSRLSPFLFRSYEMPFRVRSVFPGTTHALVWQAVRASAAAPTYFNEFRHGGLLHQDGGIMVNNPSGIALHEARLLYGARALQRGCLLSLGTGKALNKHLDYQLLARGFAGSREAPGTSWKDKFNKILDSATDTEGVHLVLNDLLPAGNYFRLNPPLNDECAMDEINPDKLNGLLTDTQAYMRRNRHKLQLAAQTLTRKRTVGQRIGDYIQHQSHIMGVRQTN